MKNKKRYLALLLSIAMLFNSNIVPTFAATLESPAAVEKQSAVKADAVEEKTETEPETAAMPILLGIQETTSGSVSFDEKKEATLKVGTNLSKLVLTPIFAENADTEGVSITYKYLDTDNAEQIEERDNAMEAVTFSDAIGTGIGEKELTIVLTKKDVTATYTLQIKRVAVIDSLVIMKYNGNMSQYLMATSKSYTKYDPLKTDYDLILGQITYDKLKFTAKDTSGADTPRLKITYNGTETYVDASKASMVFEQAITESDYQKGAMIFKLQNASYASSVESLEYTICIYPMGWSEEKISNRKVSSVDVSFIPAVEGKMYYLTTEADAAVPSDSNMKKSDYVEVEKGVRQTLNLSNLDYKAKKLTLYLVDNYSGKQTCKVTYDVQAYYPLVLKHNEDEILFDYESNCAEYIVKTYGVSTDFNVVPKVPEYIEKDNAELKIQCVYTDTEGESKTIWGTIGKEISLPKAFLEGSHKGNTIHFAYSYEGIGYEYTLTIKRQAVLNTLIVTDQDGKEIPLVKESEIEYTAVLDHTATEAIICVSGGESILINGEKTQGEYKLNLNTAGEVPKVEVQIDSEADEKPVYKITFVQKLSPLSVQNRDVTTATLKYYAYAPGELYYYIPQKNELKETIEESSIEIPTIAEVKEKGTKVDNVTEGEHELALEGLRGETHNVYMILVSDNQVITKLITVEIEEVKLLTAVRFQMGTSKTANFDEKKEAMITMPSSVSSKNTNVSVYDAKGTLACTGLTIKYSFVNASTGQQNNITNKAISNYSGILLQYSAFGNDITICVSKDGYEQEYMLHIQRESDLGHLEVTDKNGSTIKLNPNMILSLYKDYTATVTGDVIISATDVLADRLSDEAVAAKDAAIYFNGEKSEDGKFELKVRANKENVVTIKAVNGAASQREYTITFTKATDLVTFEPVITNPTDALFTLYKGEQCEERIWPDENGKYTLLSGQIYTFNIAKSGYITKTGTLALTEDEIRNYTLEKAPEGAELNNLSSEYPGFRSGDDNMSVISSKTPINSDTLELKWEKQIGDYTSANSGTSPIIVDNKIYTVSGDTVYILDKETGEVLKKGTLVASSGYGVIPPTYADGMLFVLLNGGRIQCLNAETLESLWIYKDPMGGMAYSDIRYDNGYLYVGFDLTGGAAFVCISATDEDPTSKVEVKNAVWRNTTLGTFHWSGAWSNENYVFVTAQLNNTVNSKLYCLDKKDGRRVQEVEVQAVKSSISYYNGRIYFASEDGYMHAYNLTEEGILDLENTIKPLRFASGSTASTPVIYNNRIYVGVSSGGSFADGIGSGIMVLNIDPETGTMSRAYGIRTNGFVQTSGLVTTGYEDAEGYVYVYFLENFSYGSLYMIKDRPGMTEPDKASGRLYIPNHPQYCIASAVADQDGNLYLKNDSAWHYVLKTAELYLEDIQVSGGNATLNGEIDLYGSETDQYIRVDQGTKSITLDFVANTKDAVVTIDGKQGASREITLSADKTIVNVTLKKDSLQREYTFTIYRGPVLTGIRVTTENDYEADKTYTINPSFDELGKSYTAGYGTTQKNAYVWLDHTNVNEKVTCEVISGVAGYQAGDHLEVALKYHEEKRIIASSIIIPFTDSSSNGTSSASVKITISAEDGTQARVYYLTVYTGDAFPVIEENEKAVEERTDNSAVINVESNKKGTLYYMTKSINEEEPDAMQIKSKGEVLEIRKGGNQISLTKLSRDEQILYMFMEDFEGNLSMITSVTIPSTWLLGDLNEDGKVTNADVSMLLDKVTAGESVSLSLGDLNKDGKITNADVSMLLDKITAGTI